MAPDWHALGKLPGRNGRQLASSSCLHGVLQWVGPPADPTVLCLLPAVAPAAAVKEDEGKHPYIVACVVKTPMMEITITQIWGWARAQANPELEGWTAPYTWLDADVVLLKALAEPVTGILGECLPACLAYSTCFRAAAKLLPVGLSSQLATGN